MKIIALRNFVDDDGQSYRRGDEVHGWDSEKIEHYRYRRGAGQIVSVVENDDVASVEPVVDTVPDPSPESVQTLADALSQQTVRAVLRLVDEGHVSAGEALMIEKSNKNRTTLVHALQERLENDG